MKHAAILTDNPAGQFIAYFLQKQGFTVTLLDMADHFRNSQPRNTAHFNFVPNHQDALEAFRALENELNESLLSDEIHAEPTYFSDNTFTPFVGFGETKSSAVYPVSQYNCANIYNLKKDWDQIAFGIQSQLNCKIYPFADVDEFIYSGDQLQAIRFNGDQNVKADFFILNCSINKILKFLDKDFIAARTRQRIQRSTVWTRLCFQLHHTENVHSEENFIFLPATNEQDPPLVGRFEVRGDQTISVWESYMDAEISEDPETATNLFKLFKRRIRKAFPAVEAKMKEILSVENEYQGDYGWTSEVPEITNVSENFLVAPTQFTAVPGVARCVAHAYSVVQRATQYVPKSAVTTPTLLAENPL